MSTNAKKAARRQEKFTARQNKLIELIRTAPLTPVRDDDEWDDDVQFNDMEFDRDSIESAVEGFIISLGQDGSQLWDDARSAYVGFIEGSSRPKPEKVFAVEDTWSTTRYLTPAEFRRLKALANPKKTTVGPKEIRLDENTLWGIAHEISYKVILRADGILRVGCQKHTLDKWEDTQFVRNHITGSWGSGASNQLDYIRIAIPEFRKRLPELVKAAKPKKRKAVKKATKKTAKKSARRR